MSFFRYNIIRERPYIRNISDKIAKKYIYSNKEKTMNKNYTIASAFVFASLVLASLTVFSNFAKADPAYCAYLGFGSILVNAIGLFYVFANIKSPEELQLDEVNRRRDEDHKEHNRREEQESIWRELDRLSDRIDSCKKNK
jgi:sugar phosphate permease